MDEILSRSINCEQRSAQWYERRHTLLTASEVASVLGLNHYEAPSDVLKRKRNLPVHSSGNSHTKWGEKYEPVAKEIFTQLTSESIQDVGLVLHKTIPWLAASPDALVLSGKLLEIKCPTTRKIRTNDIPIHYWIQMQIQMEVCDVDQCYFLQCEFAENEPVGDHRFSGELDGIPWVLKNHTLEIVKRDRQWFATHKAKMEQFMSSVNERPDNVDGQTNLNVDGQTTNKRSTTSANQRLNNPSNISQTWITATQTRNFLLNDPLLDWLDMYHTANLPQKDSDMTFISMLREQGRQFETKVLDEIKRNYPVSSDIEKGSPIVYQARLFNPTNETYGIADLLIRSDYLNRIFTKRVLSDDDACIGCKFSPNWHYVVVDCKFATLCLRADGVHLLNSGSSPAHKGQLYIYNKALAHMQEYEPPKAYILGRKWNYTVRGQHVSGNGWFDRLGEVDFGNVDREICDRTKSAIIWLRELRAHGSSWSINPPSRPELYPNMCNDRDFPWHSTKKWLAKQNHELTSVYYVGYAHRNKALLADVSRWSDPKCTAALLGHNGPKISPLIDNILNINRSDKPIYCGADIDFPKSAINFYLDFETVNDIALDVDTKSTSLLFLIGLGWNTPAHPEWHFEYFIADRLDQACEKEIFLQLHDTMLKILEDNDAFNSATVYHWSHAERTIYQQTAERYSSDLNQYADYLTWNWFDLCKLFTETPICIRGALTFNLKEIANAMHANGLIETVWPDAGILDGLSAMVEAVKCNVRAEQEGLIMKDLAVMKDIISYNQVDCKVLMEIVSYLSGQKKTNKLSYTKKSSHANKSSYTIKVVDKTYCESSIIKPNEISLIDEITTKIQVDDIDALPVSNRKSKKRQVEHIEELSDEAPPVKKSKRRVLDDED